MTEPFLVIGFSQIQGRKGTRINQECKSPMMSETHGMSKLLVSQLIRLDSMFKA